MNKRTLAILAALAATTIYGLNHTIAKGVMPNYMGPLGFVLLRSFGATALFWSISILGPSEKIDYRDWGRMVLAALFGMALNMLSFFKGLELSTPINSSVLVTTTPIIVVVLSAFLIREKIYLYRGIGVIMGLIGALLLVLYGQEVRLDAPNIPLGNLLFLTNALFFGLYLILVKQLLDKYHPFTVLKWLFLMGIVVVLPVGYGEFSEIIWSELPFNILWKVIFVVVGTTFCTYLFNVYALTQLKASTVSSFIYLQPLIGILYALSVGKDSLSVVKIGAACLVLLGVYLVSKRPKPGL